MTEGATRLQPPRTQADPESFFSLCPDPCMVLDPRSRILEVNAAWTSRMGVPRRDVLGTSIQQWMEPDRGSEPIWPLLGLAPNGVAICDSRMRTPGRVTIIEWHSRTTEQGILCVGRDITHERARQSKLMKSEERYRRILETSQEGIWLIDLAGQTSYVNPRMAEILGYQVVDMIGKPLFEFLGPEEKERAAINLERRRAGISDTFEFRYLHKDGHTIECLVSASPLFNEDGVAEGAVGMVMDISDRAEAARELANANHDLERRVLERTQSLQDANAELESFCYTVSHDLRAPLRSLVGFSQLLAKRHSQDLPPEALEHLAIIESAGVEMSQLVEALLRLSRMGRQAVKASIVQVHSIVERCVASQQPTAPDTTIHVGRLPPCKADPLLIHEVFTNLIHNAIKFSRNEEHPEVRIDGIVDGPVVRYRVRDNGVGFDPKYTDRIWGVFQRLHRSDEFEGTGAGLAIVKRIIERQGGTIEARSAPGRGATFIMTLPAVTP